MSAMSYCIANGKSFTGFLWLLPQKSVSADNSVVVLHYNSAVSTSASQKPCHGMFTKTKVSKLPIIHNQCLGAHQDWRAHQLRPIRNHVMGDSPRLACASTSANQKPSHGMFTKTMVSRLPMIHNQCLGANQDWNARQLGQSEALRGRYLSWSVKCSQIRTSLRYSWTLWDQTSVSRN